MNRTISLTDREGKPHHAKVLKRFVTAGKNNENESLNRTQAEFSAECLRNNYEVIREQVPGQMILPMVKANAYGHGAPWAVRVLKEMPDLAGFGVATFYEGREVRETLSSRDRHAIYVFSDSSPWTDEMGAFCEKWGLTPVLYTEEDLRNFIKKKWPERISYEVKFNTGMNRLGIHPAFANQFVRDLKGKDSAYHPEGILTHLAMGENPDSSLSRRQRETFTEIKRVLSGAFPKSKFHFANSAGIWNSKKWGLQELTDMVRPGLSLYGATPYQDAPVRGLQDVMTLRSRIVQVRTLKSGDALGYGATFTVKGKSSMTVAIVGAGYADGLHRVLSNQGYGFLRGKFEKILGRVSMDLTAVSCSPDQKVGEWVEFLGPNMDVWTQSRAASTIPYELYTSVGTRVERLYG